jgi:NAD(P)-dependent dehydrogenase (short-subunit alcohol dehydrogenase family)
LSTILITGCNRGIGLQLASQFQARGDNVIGVCREPSKDLIRLEIHLISGIDVSVSESIKNLKNELDEIPVDILINNAGILNNDKFGNINYDDIVKQFSVNTLGPLRVIESLSSNLHEGSKVVIISSRVGSIADNTSGGYYGYRASKTAVNQIGMNLTHELKPRGIAVALLHPGYVATKMTNGQGIMPANSAKGLIERIDEMNISNTGQFWHAEGHNLPW